MYPPVRTDDATAVEVEVQAAYLEMFPGGNRFIVAEIFGWAIDCFAGRYRDYQAIDALYHDFEHTLQGTLCLARLLKARHSAGVSPLTTERMFQLAIIAVLLHDTGYLKKQDDTGGTGAKYTLTHVARSADFAAHLLREKGFHTSEIQSVRNMICCTGVTSNVFTIPFQSQLERVLGLALASSDLLGQMAARDYVDKLPVLYSEFAEAVRFSGETSSFPGSFPSASVLIERTPSFWRDFIQPKLENDFQGLYRFLNDPYPDGPNDYIERISANIRRLQAASQTPQSHGAV